MEATVEIPSREQVTPECTWDLKSLFDSDDAWETDFVSLQSQIKDYTRFKGTLAQSPGHLKECLEFDMELTRALEALYTYAHLKNDEDKTNSRYQGNYEKASQLLVQYNQARSFINSEMMDIPEGTMQEYLESPDLEFFKVDIERKLRYRPFTLSQKEEALLAASAEVARIPQNTFSMLDNADLKLGSIKDTEGRDVTITQGNFQSLLQNRDRRVRKDAFETFYRAYEGHKHTFAALLSGSVKKDIFYARTRNYSSVREKAMFTEDIPTEVYDNLISTVHARLEPLYKYFQIRKRMLGLDELRVYDCSVPLVENVIWDMAYDEAVEKIGQSLAPLGSEYVEIMKKGLLKERWVDRYENKGKRSGAYSSGCYDSHPFILMNYLNDNINSVYTLAHEAGHSMHSYFSKVTQPYLYSNYTIFVAEVASTFNEALLTRYLLNQDIDREMKIYLVCREIDNFRGTLYRQTMFAEFEHLMYAAAESGEPLTVESFQRIYQELLERYFGGNVVLDPCLALECFRIPHFYFGFYVYKYATGISAAYALVERVTHGGDQELQDYLNFLKSGGSKFPIDLLKGAGVDMSSPKPIETALHKFSELVDQLDELTA